MYNIQALEEEWKRYRRNKRRPIYITLFLLFLFAILLSIWYLYSGAFNLNKYRSSQDGNSAKTTASVSMVFIDQTIDRLEDKRHAVSIDAPIDLPDAVQDDKSIDTSIKKKKKKKKKLHIEVIEVNSNPSSFNQVAKRFRLGHDTDDSMFLAKQYYKNKNYKKAEYWALQTNKVNENIEESWLIFAKAKAKRGQRNEAIRILNNYIKRSHSIEAKVLLEKIKSGKTF